MPPLPCFDGPMLIRCLESAARLAELIRTGVLVCTKAQCVPHFFFFSPQVGKGMRRRRNFTGNLRHDFNAGIGQGGGLVRIVRQKANTPEAEVAKNCDRQAEIAAIGLEAQRMIGLDGVDADILQLVGL
jgi:hypothetical protein